MSKQEILERSRKALEAFNALSPDEQTRRMVRHGTINEQGEVLFGRDENRRQEKEMDESPITDVSEFWNGVGTNPVLYYDFSIPEDLLVSAVCATNKRFSDNEYSLCTDTWLKAEELYCKSLCGPAYAHLEEGRFRTQIVTMRKGGKLKKYNNNNKDSDEIDDQPEPELSDLYREYLKSPEHLFMVKVVISNAEGMCQWCKNQATSCHHRKYDRLPTGKDELSRWLINPNEIKDMVACCDKCHNQADKRRQKQKTEDS